ncbi:hypothetical protein KC332_g16173 [Hortaea werneckii]|uniref:SCP domain-containing protein n=2 Tax=Hortaea werneckii TaxID=91943 RepID=A0A3M7I7K1_HORWE|nr:hypothetical protein KC358_g16164 [Hortaea werneckii]OTA38361.1 hypothetical protein BTJ68_01855 [Hortaea werneckii EXF-2000]KAI6901441.1 hypothetical protein KC348_g16481 [Hortaea werneckii]KAI6954461.1 hypothetical protein KC321_g16356 [Hortaea werneckii]KAI6962878.1 hypothetical protein KC329_g16177 [Hortaea werneckii]
MRSSVIAAAFAVGAAAVPLEKRAVVTDYDVVYYTQVVTVTQGAAPTTSVAVDPETTAAATTTTAAQHFGHHWKPWHWTGGFGSDESSSEASSAEPTSETSAPAPVGYTSATSWATTWTSSWGEAPSSEAPSSTYVAPSTSEAPSSTYVAPSSTAASSTSSADDSIVTSYQDKVIVHHNIHRSNHSDTGDLEWDDGLASTAQKIAESCTYAHNTEEDGGGYGQNIAAGITAENVSQVITDMFYNGEINLFADQYGKEQPDMTNFEGWGHFTQLVWKETTHVGCYTQTCDSLANVGSNVPPYFTVCNYKNAGNYANEYAANVGEPKGRNTVGAKYRVTED